MSDGIVQETEGFIKEHPVASFGIALGVLVLIFWLTRSTSPAPTATASAPNTAGYAAQLGSAQIAADAQTAQANIAANAAVAQAQIAAGVANSSMAAQQAAVVAQANSATAIAQSANSAQVAVSANTSMASEFAALAGVLNNFAVLQNVNGGNAQAYVDISNSAAVAGLTADQKAAYLQSLTGGSTQYSESQSGNSTTTTGGNFSIFGGAKGWLSSLSFPSTSSTASSSTGSTSASYTPGQGALQGSSITTALSSADFTKNFQALSNVAASTNFHAS